MKKITITENEIEVCGFIDTDFKDEDLGGCADVARTGIAWALKRIAEEQMHDATGDREKLTRSIGD